MSFYKYRFSLQITFQAFASPNPIIWIDSFRYIGPSFDKDSCLIYDEEITTAQYTSVTREITDDITTNIVLNTTSPVTEVTTTTEASITTKTSTVTELSTTTEELTTAKTSSTAVVSTTTSPEESNEDCLTEDFENNFEDNFTNSHGTCVGFSMWHVQQYSSVNICSPHPGSARFIMPLYGSSCVASYKFHMTVGGMIQVKVYMVSTSPVDQLTVTVFKGNDVPIGRAFLNVMSPGYVDGWQNLNINIYRSDTFEGYVSKFLCLYKEMLNS